jgi:hypothetical protein
VGGAAPQRSPGSGFGTIVEQPTVRAKTVIADKVHSFLEFSALMVTVSPFHCVGFFRLSFLRVGGLPAQKQGEIRLPKAQMIFRKLKKMDRKRR